MEPTDHRFVCPSCGQGRVSDRIIEPTPLSAVPIPMRLSPASGKLLFLKQEITSLLDKRAILELDPMSLSKGFYSRIFLVPKKHDGFRPVFDLKSLNQHVCKEKFKMTTPRVVSNALHKGDWAVSIDLKDAYFHVPKHKKSRHLLRFAVAENDVLRVFEFRALPFGLTSAPRVFTFIALRSSRAHACCGASTVSGRLAAEEPKQDIIGSANELVGRHHSPGGVHTQRREISTSTHSATDKHRCRISSRFRSDVSTDGPSSSVRRTDFRPIEPPSIDSLLFGCPSSDY